MDLNTTSNEELVKIYKYSILHRYMSLRIIQGYYHPVYEHNTMSIPVNKFMSINALYSIHEMTLLNEIWNRYINGTFYEQAWWESQKIFMTKISIP